MRMLFALPPPRRGPRPKTQCLPHLQLDQWPPPDVAQKLIERCLGLSGVGERESRLAAPQTKAVWLAESLVGGPAEAFIDDHEFCHLHALPEGSVHLMLPAGVRESILELGWGETHPLVRSGAMPDTLVMIYAPRDEMELEVVLSLAEASYRFARGHH